MADLSYNINPRTGAYMYRPLRLTGSHMRGADVFALQTAVCDTVPSVVVNGTRTQVIADGDFGRVTDEAIFQAQGILGLTTDRIAGINTQRVLGNEVAKDARTEFGVIEGALYGQIEHESGWQLGNFTAKYSNGSRDRGPVQMNSMVYPDDTHVFDTVYSVDVLAKTIVDNYKLYKNYGVITSNVRLWDLAQGSWNAPAWTDRLAKGIKLSASQSKHIEAYIQSVTAYRVR